MEALQDDDQNQQDNVSGDDPEEEAESQPPQPLGEEQEEEGGHRADEEMPEDGTAVDNNDDLVVVTPCVPPPPNDVAGPRFQKEVVGKRIRVLFEIVATGKCERFDGRITSFRYHATRSSLASSTKKSKIAAAGAGQTTSTPPRIMYKWCHTVRLNKDGDVRRLDLDQRWRDGTCWIEGVPDFCPNDVVPHNAWDEKSIVDTETLLSEEEEKEEKEVEEDEEEEEEKEDDNDYDHEEEATGDLGEGQEDNDDEAEEEDDDDEDQKPAARKQSRRGGNDKKMPAAARKNKSNRFNRSGASTSQKRTSSRRRSRSMTATETARHKAKYVDDDQTTTVGLTNNSVTGRVRSSRISSTTTNQKTLDHDTKKKTKNKTRHSHKTPKKRQSSGDEKHSDGPPRTKKKEMEKEEIEEGTSLSGAEHVRRRVRVNFTMSDGTHAWYDGVIAAHNAVVDNDNDDDDDEGQSPRSTYHVHFEDGDQIWMQLFTGGYEFI
jgi:hypothetical protein